MSRTHSNEKHSSVMSFKPKSLTLLNETGNVEIYRVSEDTRKKVEEDTRRINKQNMDLYHKSRKLIKQRENQKLKLHNDSAEAMRLRWVQKLTNSPYNVDQMQREEHRRISLEEREIQREDNIWRSKFVSNMTGKATEGILNRERMRALNNEQRLALTLRQTINDDKLINAEKVILDHMLLEEIDAIKRRLPNMPVPNDLFQNESEEDSNLRELSDHSLVRSFAERSRTRHFPSKSSASRTTVPHGTVSSSIATHPSFAKHLPKDNTAKIPLSGRPIESERSIDTDLSGNYEAPGRTMQNLEDELGQLSIR